MKRVIAIVMVGLMLAAALAGCGSKKDTIDSPVKEEGEVLSATELAAAPRKRPAPEGDPYQFEAPFSVGAFARQSLTGRPTAVQSGAQEAIYKSDDGSQITLTVYYLESDTRAVQSVQFALKSGSVTKYIEGPYYGTGLSFALAQDRQGRYMAVWNHNRWYFMATTSGSLDALNAFLDEFPY